MCVCFHGNGWARMVRVYQMGTGLQSGRHNVSSHIATDLFCCPLGNMRFFLLALKFFFSAECSHFRKWGNVLDEDSTNQETNKQNDQCLFNFCLFALIEQTQLFCCIYSKLNCVFLCVCVCAPACTGLVQEAGGHGRAVATVKVAVAAVAAVHAPGKTS